MKFLYHPFFPLKVTLMGTASERKDKNVETDYIHFLSFTVSKQGSLYRGKATGWTTGV
jgi:hypothetical protein